MATLSQRHAPLIGRMLRFAIVGVVVTGGYAGTMYAGIRWLGMPPLYANLLGCAASILISYIGQKYFTFRSDGAHRIELPKFLLACMIAVAGSSISTVLVADAGLDFRIGILIAALLLPLCNFTIMNLWVFSRKSQPARMAGTAERHD